MVGFLKNSAPSTKDQALHTASRSLVNGMLFGLAGGVIAACCGIIVASKSFELLAYGTRGAAGPLRQITTACTAIAYKSGSLIVAPARFGLELILNGKPDKQVVKGQTSKQHIDVTASSNTSTKRTTSEHMNVLDTGIPKHYQVVTDHEARWLQAFYTKQVAFWSTHSIEPNSLTAPKYRQKTAILVQKNKADKSDMKSLLFAEFVCGAKQLPHKGLACFDAVRGDALSQLAPPA